MIKNQALFEGLKSIIPRVLPLIKPAIKAKYFPEQIDKYPNLSYKANGFPSISCYPSKVRVASLFRDSFGDKKPTIDLEELPEYNELIDDLQNNPDFVAYYHTPQLKSKEGGFKFRLLHTEFYVHTCIERYYYLFDEVFEEEKLESILRPLENFLNSTVLSFDISVPILFIQFDVEQFQLVPGIFLRKINDEIQRARYTIIGQSQSAVESVFMSATHELVLTNYTYERLANWVESSFSQASIYPTNIIETFLTILKIVTDYTTGFSQFLVHPKDWAMDYSADLVYLTGAATKNYPTYFDDYYWNNSEYPKVTFGQIETVSNLLKKAMDSKTNKLEFALKRFYKSIMRQEEEDVIIDLIIALEIILSDSEKTEITHKLALRLAALLSKCSHSKFDARQVFNNMKNIYSYRSSIMHGSHTTSKKREIKLEENIVVPTVTLAKDYLREILKIVILEPKYLEPSEVDNLLLM